MLHVPFFFVWYTLNAIIVPIVLLPICVVVRLSNGLTHFRISCWDLVTYNAFFRMLRLNHRVHGTFIESGFVLANHRSWCDFGYDPYVSRSAVVGRSLGFFAMLFQSLLGLIENRFIVIDRTRSRHDAFDSVRRFIHANGPYSRRILFWPEGRRCTHTQLITFDETKRLIKQGLLKSIYEHRLLPVQIMMSNNKERVSM